MQQGATAQQRPETPWEYRGLIANFTRRDLRARFNGTALGWVWTLVGPLATIAIYSLVFSVFIRISPPPFGNGRAGIYAVFLITGLVTWNFLNHTITSGMPSLLGNGSLLQKVYFPSFVPVVATGVTIAIQSLIELALVLVVLALFLNVSWTWLLIPLWAALLAVFGQSISYSLAVANVHWRDLSQIVAVLMQLLFFLTPVIFPLSLVPEYLGPVPARAIVELNPIGQFVTAGRNLMYELTPPSLPTIAYLVLWTAGAALLARTVFRRWGRDIGEAV